MDSAVALWFAGMERIPALDALMAFVTFLGDHGLIWIAITVVLLLCRRTRRLGVACALALILETVACNFLIKPLVARTRPYLALGLPLLIPPPGGCSFPSCHAGSSFAAATVLFLRLRGWKRYIPVVLAAAIGFSRIFFTVHYVTDVAAGAALGIGIGILALRICEAQKHTKKG